MLTFYQKEKLEIIEKWLHEIKDSPEYMKADYHPDVTIADSLQGVGELLDHVEETGYVPPKAPSPHEIKAYIAEIQANKRSLLSKLSDFGVSAAIASLILAGYFGVSSLFSSGISQMDKATGDRLFPRVDWAATSKIFQGAAVVSVSLFLGGTLTSVAAGIADNYERQRTKEGY